MNVFIFAIGGTGARVLRSLTFCLASGIEKIPQGTSIVPLIIDYDKDNGDKKRAIKNLNDYYAIRREAYNGIRLEGDERCFFHPDIKHLSDVATPAGNADVNVMPNFEFTFGLDGQASAGTFARRIDLMGMGGPTWLTKDLLSSLYNDEPQTSPMTELNLDLSVGFKGNPNIGSIIFENLKDDPEFRRFKSVFNPQTDRVFIISSIFGGTGSSGFPRIVDAIHYAGIAGFDSATIGAAIVMPYFKVNTPAGGAINSNIFNSKQKAALSYYDQKDDHGKSIYDKLTTAYFIGEDISDQTAMPYSEGRDTQKNDAHMVEFLAALGILDFICKSDVQLKETKYREYGISKDLTPGDKYNFLHFSKKDYDDYLEFITCMALTFRYYREYIVEGEIPENTQYYKDLGIQDKIGSDMYLNLEEFVDDFDEWLDELAGQNDALKPFLQRPRVDDSSDPQADNLNDYIEGMYGPEGGIFSQGAKYTDFNSLCNSVYKKIKGNWNNQEHVLLETWYQAVYDLLRLFKQDK